jgi:hypothetical protein
MNAKQDILGAVDELCKCIERGWPISAFRFIQTIRAILSTHTLEPIDDRPFDPTLCGFERVEDSAGAWSNGSHILYHLHGNGMVEDIASACQFGFPWPATQSDGEKLFKLLGVLKQ